MFTKRIFPVFTKRMYTIGSNTSIEPLKTTRNVEAPQDQEKWKKTFSKLNETILSERINQFTHILKTLEDCPKFEQKKIYSATLRKTFLVENGTQMTKMIANQISKDGQNTTAYFNDAMLYFQNVQKNTPKAINVLEFILQNDELIKPDQNTFSATMEIYLNYHPKPQEYFHLMVEKYQLKPTSKIYYLVIESFIRVQNFQGAYEFMKLMLEEHEIKPDGVISEVVTSALARDNRYRSEGIDFMDLMFTKYNIQPTQRNLNEILCKMKDLDTALEFFHSIQSKYSVEYSSILYTSIIRIICTEVETDLATEYFEKMMESGIKPTSYIYDSMITAFCKAKKMDVSEKYYFQLKEEFSSVPRFKYIKQISDAYRKMGQIEKADEFVTSEESNEKNRAILNAKPKISISERLSRLKSKLSQE
eukprot:gene6628-10794_t